MKAMEIGPPGGTGSIRLVSRATPVPKPDEVMLKVEAVSLNYRDLRLIAAPVRSFIPTCECAGEIVSVGSDVASWQTGQRVLSAFYQGWVDGPFRSNYLTTVPGSGVDGVLAEYVTLKASSIAHSPNYLSTIEAATIPCAGVTAYNALFGGRRVGPDDTVLVLGTGGVSLFALQFATHQGARVIVTSSSDVRLQRAVQLGAAETVNYVQSPDWAEEVLRITAGRGAEFVVDVVGDISQSVRVLADNGQLSLIGTSLGGKRTESAMRASDLSVGFTTIRRFIVGPVTMLVDTVNQLALDSIHPIIGEQFDFSEAADAFARLQMGGVFGKIVIKVSD